MGLEINLNRNESYLLVENIKKCVKLEKVKAIICNTGKCT